VTITKSAGVSTPLGVNQTEGNINFAIFTKNAKTVTLGLYDVTSKAEIQKFILDPKVNKTGDIWHIALQNLPIPVLYSYFMDGLKSAPHLYDKKKALLDPYAKVIDTSIEWGKPLSTIPRAVVYREEPFDWQGVSSPKIPMNELIIYEMHVRGFTYHTSSNSANKGTFLGIIDKIPYLLDLGINAIELMPIFEFDETKNHRVNPVTSKKLCNYWGYETMSFFCPMNRYATSSDYGKAKQEFQTMIRELHRNKIEVILDVVFNHVGESKDLDNYRSFLGIDRSTYYLLDNNEDTNFSGCGNTMNLNDRMMQDFVLDCLHYWVVEMGVDGFRFDLATIMNRESNGKLVHESSLIHRISVDPILAEKKLIAEPWDAGGGYQLGGFCPKKKRWSEWNDQFKNNLLSFIKGDDFSKNAIADSVMGSQKIFTFRSPQASINYVAAHDGFTTRDLVSYNQKHNESNGEQNQDGNNFLNSWNCGVEGDIEQIEILKLREKQQKNFLVALFLFQGVPMLLMGDEYGHTKSGNNNSWCHDDEVNYFLWDQLRKNRHLYEFIQKLIQFRKENSVFTKGTFLKDNDIKWQGLKPSDLNWDDPKPILGWTLIDKTASSYFIFFNSTQASYEIQLPEPKKNMSWHLVVNTNGKGPNDFYESNRSLKIDSNYYLIQEHTAIVLKEHFGCDEK